MPVSLTDASSANWPGSNIQGHAMRANAPEWEPGRRDTLETLLSDFVPPFPASGRRNVGALPRKVSSCQTGVWVDAGEGRTPRHQVHRLQGLRAYMQFPF